MLPVYISINERIMKSVLKELMYENYVGNILYFYTYVCILPLLLLYVKSCMNRSLDVFVFYVLLCETDQRVGYSKTRRCNKEIKCNVEVRWQ